MLLLASFALFVLNFGVEDGAAHKIVVDASDLRVYDEDPHQPVLRRLLQVEDAFADSTSESTVSYYETDETSSESAQDPQTVSAGALDILKGQVSLQEQGDGLATEEPRQAPKAPEANSDHKNGSLFGKMLRLLMSEKSTQKEAGDMGSAPRRLSTAQLPSKDSAWGPSRLHRNTAIIRSRQKRDVHSGARYTPEKESLAAYSSDETPPDGDPGPDAWYPSPRRPRFPIPPFGKKFPMFHRPDPLTGFSESISSEHVTQDTHDDHGVAAAAVDPSDDEEDQHTIAYTSLEHSLGSPMEDAATNKYDKTDIPESLSDLSRFTSAGHHADTTGEPDDDELYPAPGAGTIDMSEEMFPSVASHDAFDNSLENEAEKIAASADSANSDIEHGLNNKNEAFANRHPILSEKHSSHSSEEHSFEETFATGADFDNWADQDSLENEDEKFTSGADSDNSDIEHGLNNKNEAFANNRYLDDSSQFKLSSQAARSNTAGAHTKYDSSRDSDALKEEHKTFVTSAHHYNTDNYERGVLPAEVHANNPMAARPSSPAQPTGQVDESLENDHADASSTAADHYVSAETFAASPSDAPPLADVHSVASLDPSSKTFTDAVKTYAKAYWNPSVADHQTASTEADDAKTDDSEEPDPDATLEPESQKSAEKPEPEPEPGPDPHDYISQNHPTDVSSQIHGKAFISERHASNSKTQDVSPVSSLSYSTDSTLTPDWHHVASDVADSTGGETTAKDTDVLETSHEDGEVESAALSDLGSPMEDAATNKYDKTDIPESLSDLRSFTSAGHHADTTGEPDDDELYTAPGAGTVEIPQSEHPTPATAPSTLDESHNVPADDNAAKQDSEDATSVPQEEEFQKTSAHNLYHQEQQELATDAEEVPKAKQHLGMTASSAHRDVLEHGHGVLENQEAKIHHEALKPQEFRNADEK